MLLIILLIILVRKYVYRRAMEYFFLPLNVELGYFGTWYLISAVWLFCACSKNGDSVIFIIVNLWLCMDEYVDVNDDTAILFRLFNLTLKLCDWCLIVSEICVIGKWRWDYTFFKKLSKLFCGIRVCRNVSCIKTVWQYQNRGFGNEVSTYWVHIRELKDGQL